MQSAAGNPLPRAVNIVGDRIGLNYNIKKKEATQNYIEENQKSRLELSHLKNSYYSLNEFRTKKGDKDPVHRLSEAKNPLKLNARIRRQLYKLSPEEKQLLNYRDFDKVHSLWIQYAKTILSIGDSSNIFKMDLHGCNLRCTASKNPSLVGTEGIVVQETKNTFLVIKQTSGLVTLPKRESIFEFNIEEKLYRIHGCNLLFTTQTRTKVKYKQKRCLSNV